MALVENYLEYEGSGGSMANTNAIGKKETEETGDRTRGEIETWDKKGALSSGRR